MARAFRILAALAVLIGFGWSQAHAQVPLTGAGQGVPGGGAAPSVQAIDLGTAFLCASGTSCSYTNLTVTAALPNSAIAVLVINSDNGATVSGLSATWAAQSLTQVSTEASGNFQNWIFGGLAPTSGAQTLSLSWTGTARIFVCAVSLKNVKQTSVATAFINAIGNTTTGSAVSSITVTSQANDLVLTSWSTPASWTGVYSGSEICRSNGGTINDVAASSDAGSSSVNATATLTPSNNSAAASIDVVHN